MDTRKIQIIKQTGDRCICGRYRSKEIYRMKLSGMSQTAIANAWNKQGVLSPMEYKHSLGIRIQDNFKTHEQAEWSAMSVKRILENEVYTGTLVQGKEQHQTIK